MFSEIGIGIVDKSEKKMLRELKEIKMGKLLVTTTLPLSVLKTWT